MKVKDVIDKLNHIDSEKDVLFSPCCCPGDEVTEVRECGDIVEIE